MCQSYIASNFWECVYIYKKCYGTLITWNLSLTKSEKYVQFIGPKL